MQENYHDLETTSSFFSNNSLFIRLTSQEVKTDFHRENELIKYRNSTKRNISYHVHTCLQIPIGRLDPLVARLIGATTATRVGDGADWRFLGGRAGGLEKEKEN